MPQRPHSTGVRPEPEEPTSPNVSGLASQRPARARPEAHAVEFDEKNLILQNRRLLQSVTIVMNC